eukprot:s102_g41.t1
MLSDANETHEKNPRFVAQSFGDMVLRSPRESEADVEVFSQSAKAWLPGRVALLAAPGKITVCYSLEGKKCRKHLSPFTQMIRVEDRIEESEEEADPDLSFHQVFRFFLGDLETPQYSLQRTLEKAAQMDRQQKHQARSIHPASATRAREIAVEARDNYHRHGVLFLDEELVPNPEFNEKLGHRGTVRMASLPAKLIDGRPRARDVFQGAEAHNCGFMAALAAIADHEDGYLVRLLLQQHNEQEHDDDLNAEGCYRVSLFLNTSSRNLEKYRQVHPSLIASEQEVFFSNTRNSIKAATRGSWRTVVVDDAVPSDCNRRWPRACRPNGPLWPCIIEKAFAKACGSYEKMDFVDLTDALVILTGQSTFRIELARLASSAHKKLFRDLCEYKRRGILVTAGILQPEARVLPNGLVTKHAYTLLDLVPVLDHTRRLLTLVKLRNPWGQNAWCGDFGPKDMRWDPELHWRIHGDDPGVFCICWADFLQNFTKIHVCQVGDSASAWP